MMKKKEIGESCHERDREEWHESHGKFMLKVDRIKYG